MIHDYHKYDEELGALYDYSDLLSVRLRNDSGLEAFMNSWDGVLAGMKVTPAEELLEFLFLNQLRHSTVLKEEVAHYDRAKRGSETRTYAFLMESVRRDLERQRLLHNRKAVSKGLGGDSAGILALPAAPKKEPKPPKTANRSGSPGSDNGRRQGVCFDF